MLLKAIDANLVDKVWSDKRPALSNEKIFIHKEKFSGMSVTDKYKLIAKKMHKNLNMMLLTNLDDIAWLLNLRGNDILYNPLFFSYVIFHKD